MADPNQLALLKKSVEEWNAWREVYPWPVDFREADLNRADLRFADLSYADFSSANLRGADLSSANLSNADLSEADLSNANLRGADLSEAILSKADHRRAELKIYFENASFDRTGGDAVLIKLTTLEPHPSKSFSPTDWLSLVETVGSNLLVTTATVASIIQGFDVVERRWREHQEKHNQQGTQTPPPASTPSTQPAAASSHKTPAPDAEIVEILLVMDDGSQHGFKRWISDPDALKVYMDAFSDPTSKVKPLQVVFKKREGRALVIDVTTGGKDNKQLNVILGYLDADPL